MFWGYHWRHKQTNPIIVAVFIRVPFVKLFYGTPFQCLAILTTWRFVRSVRAIFVSIAHPCQGNAFAIVTPASEIVWWTNFRLWKMIFLDLLVEFMNLSFSCMSISFRIYFPEKQHKNLHTNSAGSGKAWHEGEEFRGEREIQNEKCGFRKRINNLNC